MTELEHARRRARALYARDRASQALGMEVDIPGNGGALARLQVGEAMINGFGVCHGGYLFALADTAFAFACNARGGAAYAAAGAIEFLRPAKLGDRLLAEAVERWRGGRSGIYDVTVRNQDGDIVALFRGRAHEKNARETGKSDTENLEFDENP